MKKRQVRTSRRQRRQRRQEQGRSSRQRRREEQMRAARRRRQYYAVGIGLGLVAIGMVVIWGLRPFSQTTTLVADPDNAAQVAIGQAVYARSCASCHGANLEGQPNWQEPLPSGGLPAPPHDATGHTWHHADDWLFKTTKYGGQAAVPQNYRNFISRMPAFKDVLTDSEIWAVLSYIKSSWPTDIRAKQVQTTLNGGRHQH